MVTNVLILAMLFASARALCSSPDGALPSSVPSLTGIQPDLSMLAQGKGWNTRNRSISLVKERDRTAIRFDERPNDGLATWLQGPEFKNGVIECDLRGKNVLQKSFLGIAFHGLNANTYDLVYFRPFNFKSEDLERRSHAVQYCSLPTYDWPKLRADHPLQYEQPVHPIPDPEAWFHVRVVVHYPQVSVFVNNAQEPSLTVNQLSDRKRGWIGLWVGNNSGGDFADLKITPEQDTGQQSAAYGSDAEAAHRVQADDAKIYYETYGEGGRPLVLLHGDLYGSIDEFAPLIREMSKRRKVIAIATRGHGRSELGKQPLSYELFAKDAATVIRHEAQGQVDVVGFSGGAVTAYLLAAKHPEMVNRLVAIGGPLGVNGGTPKGVEISRHFDAAAFTRNNSEFVTQRKKLMPAPQLWDDFLNGMAKLWRAEVYVTPEQVRSIQIPALIVAGDHDDFNRAESAVDIYRLLPKGQLAIIPGRGHVVLDGKPDLTIAIISAFLQ